MQIEEFPSERAVLHFTSLKSNYDSCTSGSDLLRTKRQLLWSGSWPCAQGSALGHAWYTLSASRMDALVK